jgi:beta-lactamase regulating signal transducer with metallopeptidase domain
MSANSHARNSNLQTTVSLSEAANSSAATPLFSATAMNRSSGDATLESSINVTTIDSSNASGNGISYIQNTSSSDTNMAILISLIVMILVLLGILTCLIVPPIVLYVKRRMPVNPKQLDARYETVEGWLITKVGSFRSCFHRNFTRLRRILFLTVT